MMRWLIILVCGLWLAGCGDTARVERKQLVEPEEEQPEPGAGHGMSGWSLHGKAPTEPSGKAAEVPQGPEVTLGEVHLTAPKAWVRQKPRSTVISAEFKLPRAEGDAADGRLTVTAAGGGIEENVKLWRAQFGGKPEKESQEKLELQGAKVTLLDLSGTFQDIHAQPGDSAERPGYRMLGAIAEVGGQFYFIKAYGPAKTMTARAQEFREFVRSLKSTRAAG